MADRPAMPGPGSPQTGLPHMGKTAARLARHAARVRWAKYALPIAAALLLSSIALWPEVERALSRATRGFTGLSAREIGYGTMVSPRFRGLDENNQAFVVTADTASRVGSERVNLANPAADLSLRGGDWLLVRAPRGVFAQSAQQLDLDGWVTLYRADGTLMQMPYATIDVRQGAAASAAQTIAQGPFGTLEAQGFTLTAKGQIVQFAGPARLVINAQH